MAKAPRNTNASVEVLFDEIAGPPADENYKEFSNMESKEDCNEPCKLASKVKAKTPDSKQSKSQGKRPKRITANSDGVSYRSVTALVRDDIRLALKHAAVEEDRPEYCIINDALANYLKIK